jgi:hypothetical protein
VLTERPARMALDIRIAGRYRLGRKIGAMQLLLCPLLVSAPHGSVSGAEAEGLTCVPRRWRVVRRHLPRCGHRTCIGIKTWTSFTSSRATGPSQNRTVIRCAGSQVPTSRLAKK